VLTGPPFLPGAAQLACADARRHRCCQPHGLPCRVPQAAIEKKLAATALVAEVAAANSEQIRRKEVMKLRDRDEDQRIAEYILNKELREQVRTAACLVGQYGGGGIRGIPDAARPTR
jgi:hypothetical protein